MLLDFYEACPYQTKKFLQNPKWQTSRYFKCKAWKYSSFTFSDMNVFFFFYSNKSSCFKKAHKQHYEMDLSNVKNEYRICFYKQLYEANLGI